MNKLLTSILGFSGDEYCDKTAQARTLQSDSEVFFCVRQ